ncbi:tRNA A64-2'-O-ribosylphosphate transferase [Rhodofomes roseus]|uniref:tRNA A64-2'-O-ribosylphosphate transferase n=1 Tax=Rhodofomes roseus TaxID=34475 RepID=A0ABQ8KB80_9APHY|nr:tRNA A64-2'-O-ribosylphosphate transferase [Rhodofomes roseus]KAH9834126.1 tRNA A64-2'-O-ribosylphosphate transferase [Rhodofomes roseus]
MELIGLHEEQSLALNHLRKESLDIYNRLHSTAEDIEFVRTVRLTYQHLPILPNQRCGLWYVDPQMARQEPAYFKSTDGHFGNWSFNLRRPNLHLLSMIVSQGGMILVDSTRSGKRIPDALSKTVPIWCAVINRAVQRKYPDKHKADWDLELYCPSGTVSAQEKSQIEARLDGWVDSLVGSSYILSDLFRPLHPFWITPSTSVFPSLDPGPTQRFYPIVCVSASKQIQEGMERRTNGFVYVQGSGDDHELWGMGLTPKLFWTYQDELLRASRSELPELIKSLLGPCIMATQPLHREWGMKPTPIIQVGGRILICSTSAIPTDFSGTIPGIASRTSFLIVSASSALIGGGFEADNVLRLQMADGRKDQILYLQSILPRSMAFIESRLSRGESVCVCCDSGKDASVGVALAALQLFFDDKGASATTHEEQDTLRHTATKQSISTRLQWIISSRPEANPSRATLKRVNEYILTSPSFRRQRGVE